MYYYTIRPYALCLALVIGVALCRPFIFVDRLHLRYGPGQKWVSPGDTLSAQQTANAPLISAENLECDKKHILFFIDMDVVLEGAPMNVLHWYQPDMQADCARSILVNQGDNGIPYLGPNPPPGSKHRYVVLAYKQPDDYVFPPSFNNIFSGDTFVARARFDVNEFAKQARLGSPAATTHFFV